MSRDALKPLFAHFKSPYDELKGARWATFISSLIPITIGLVRADNLYGFVFTSFEVAGPLLAFPFWGGVLGLKPDRRSFYVASVATIVSFVLAKHLLPVDHNHFAVLVAVSANGLFFLGGHYLRNGGFVIEDRKASVKKKT